VMNKLTFRLQVITPLFMSGADQQGAELRPPSIRGALRFWFRAMMGGVVEGDLKRLRDLEASIFGGVDSQGSMHASQVKISLQGDFIPARTKELGLDSDVKYLLYSPYLSGIQRPQYIPPGTSFQVILTSSNPKALDIMVSSLWLLTFLGGIGTRSRRGAGALRFQDDQGTYSWRYRWGDESDEVSLLQLSMASSARQLANELKSSLEIIDKIFHHVFNQLSNDPPMLPSFDMISRSTYVLGVLSPKSNSWGTWQEALKAFGAFYKNWRRYKNREGGSHKRPLEERQYFGLPLANYDQSNRRASPLWIRPAQLTGDRYCLIVQWFYAQHLNKDHTPPLMIGEFLKDLEKMEEWQVDWVSPYNQLIKEEAGV